jgi:hypothetical protein
MKYIANYSKPKGWHIVRIVISEDNYEYISLSEEEVADIVIKLNSIACQDSDQSV